MIVLENICMILHKIKLFKFYMSSGVPFLMCPVATPNNATTVILKKPTVATNYLTECLQNKTTKIKIFQFDSEVLYLIYKSLP